MANPSYKTVLIIERNNASPSPELNTPDSLSEDLTRQLQEKLALEPDGTEIAHYQYGGERAGGRRHSVSYTHLTLPTICSV